MSDDQLKATPGQAAGQAGDQAPVEPSVQPARPDQAQVSQQEQPEYLTRAEAEQMVKDVLNQARSYADKGRVRVESAVKAVEQSVETLRSLGQDISPEQEKEMRAAAIQKAMSAPDEPEADGKAAAQQPTSQPGSEPFLDMVLEMQKQIGVELTDDDPEIADLPKTNNPYVALKGIENALLKKKERLASNNPIQTTTPAGNAARVPASGKPATERLSPRDKLSKGLGDSTGPSPSFERDAG